MFWLISLFVFETILEGILCSSRTNTSSLQRILTAMAAGMLAVVLLLLSIVDWQVWVWVVPFGLYRIINLARVYARRLPPERLRTAATRAFAWLVGLQIGTALLAWVVTFEHLGVKFFAVVVGLQLLVSLVLLRASTNTWQHSEVTQDPAPLNDSLLPSISVLVPARNETDDLQRCLESLVASNYPKLEILVYDDCSANRHTPEIIRSFAHSGVRFIQGDVPDETRWLAKNYAYERLSNEASGDIFIFCGVDAAVSPDSLRKLVCLLEERNKDMLSIMPVRYKAGSGASSLLQSMRYYWEVCLPRGFFKRPPVLSTLWMIRKTALEAMGGFESVSRSVTPEAPLAKKAVAGDVYDFIRSDSNLGVYSNKSSAEQYATSIRVRYPQLHRRIELIALAGLAELIFFLGPFIGLALASPLSLSGAYVLMWVVCSLCLVTTYAMVAVGSKLTSQWYGWLLMPIAFAVDLAILHTSMWKYEFSSVDWKGRNVCIPVMHMSNTVSGPDSTVSLAQKS